MSFDINKDNKINIRDVQNLINIILNTTDSSGVDFNDDNVVNIIDVLRLIKNAHLNPNLT